MTYSGGKNAESDRRCMEGIWVKEMDCGKDDAAVMEEQFPVRESRPVWCDGSTDLFNQYAEFWQDFLCEDEAVTFFVSCDSRAVVCLDDRLVGFVLYDGTRELGFYEIFDLEPFLAGEQGKIKSLRISVYYQGKDSNCYTASRPYVIFGAKVRGSEGNGKTLFCSGENTWSRHNLHYKTGEMESNQMGYVWHYDASIKEGDWEKAEILGEGKKRYRERPILRQKLSGRQTSVLCGQGNLKGEGSLQPCYLIYDLGEECTGLLELEVEAKAGSLILISWGEHLTEGRVRRCVGTRHFLCSYRCRNGRQVFLHPFHRLGLRYLELEIHPAAGGDAERCDGTGGVVCHYAGIRPLLYPVQEKGAFQCADPLHRRIYDTSVRTLRLCMHEHYEDCPWREQALYALDAANQMLCGYYCFEEYRFAAASLELLGEEMGEDGFLPLHVPGTDAVTIPCYTFMWVTALWEYVQHAKDEALICRLWPKVRRAVDLRLAERMDGVLFVPAETCYWNFYEWNSVLSGEPIYRTKSLEKRADAPYMMSFIMMLDACSRMAHMLGDEVYSRQTQQAAEEMRRTCHRLFWDEQAECYHTCAYRGQNGFVVKREGDAELVQAFAVLSKVAGERERGILLEKLAEKGGTLVPCTLAMMRYKYEALMQEEEQYRTWVFEDIRRVWGGMLEKGATSFWETEKGAADFDGAGSLCHGWSAIPVWFYHVYYRGEEGTEA